MEGKFKLVWVVYVCLMVTLVSVETAYVTYMVYVVQKCSVGSTDPIYVHGNGPYLS
jgi:hypothetical protein